MYRTCVYTECEHYALHRVTSSDGRFNSTVCHNHVSWFARKVSRSIGWRHHVVVSTSSAVVVRDILDWRTRGITAYDVLRQIGA